MGVARVLGRVLGCPGCWGHGNLEVGCGGAQGDGDWWLAIWGCLGCWGPGGRVLGCPGCCGAGHLEVGVSGYPGVLGSGGGSMGLLRVMGTSRWGVGSA